MTHAKCLIIGGGIGGMSAALCLAQAGFDVHVVEQASEFTEIGAGIQLAPNALRVLDKLGLLADIDRCAVRPRTLMFFDIDTAEQLANVDLGDSFASRYGYFYYVLHRGDLLDILVSACRAEHRITMEANKKVDRICNERTCARVGFTDGTAYTADAVVAADGLWSTARALLSNDHPVCSGYVAYRGAVPINEIVPLHDNIEVIWIGPHKHLVQYPIRGGELYNQVAVFRSDQFRQGFDSSIEWGTPDELDQHFGTACDHVRSSVTLLKRERRWPMYDRAPIDNWTLGRVTLLGDAAHPMLQYLAQGACQAIEDAHSLAMHMSAHRDDVVAAFASYQNDRLPRTAQIQRLARVWGDIWHATDSIIPALRNRVLARDSAEHYRDLDWLYQTSDR
ncbi:FAD-dependent monooxygenase [Mycobacterium sp. 663a-19]|uniref:FAD-dependent monooxygenase n=1 Tax=Mycobacterium sp. 663a-19 TaxID=2986148 RepID=UPI002D1F8426|nr:FAD-dependent monooxygenase [Mycobacterium sp. 663a-19]MEB3980073.1 FAD-dependent monooxygenase [Mycobacterium sp. 663a-19]